jgi:hypothetical protein
MYVCVYALSMMSTIYTYIQAYLHEHTHIQREREREMEWNLMRTHTHTHTHTHAEMEWNLMRTHTHTHTHAEMEGNLMHRESEEGKRILADMDAQRCEYTVVCMLYVLPCLCTCRFILRGESICANVGAPRCVFVCIHMHTYTMWVCVCMYSHAYIHNVGVCLYSHAYTHEHVHNSDPAIKHNVHEYIHTYIHTYTAQQRVPVPNIMTVPVSS